MSLPCRFALLLCALPLALPALAQDYPSKPVRIVIPFPAGGTTDIIARILGARLSKDWKQPVVIDNRPGGGANIGAEHAVRSPADGYTLLMASTAHSINASLYPKLPYDPVKDFAPVSVVAETAQVLVVHPSIPVRTVRELVALLKRRPGEMVYSSAGNGSQPHLSAELFASMTGTRMLHVPYKGGPQAMTDLIAGHVALSFATAPSAVPNVRSGKVRALGVSTRARIPALPDVPPIADVLPGYESTAYFGLLAPANLPRDILTRLHAAAAKAAQSPELRSRLEPDGSRVLGSTPEEFRAFLVADVEKWRQVVKATGAKPE